MTCGELWADGEYDRLTSFLNTEPPLTNEPSMRIAQVIGTVTLSQVHPTLLGGPLKLAVPMTLDSLYADQLPDAEELVVYDEFGAGVGQRIMLSEGGEAAQPFHPQNKPVDAYNAGILDQIQLTPAVPRR